VVLLFLLKLSFSPGRTGGFQLLRDNQKLRPVLRAELFSFNSVNTIPAQKLKKFFEKKCNLFHFRRLYM